MGSSSAAAAFCPFPPARFRELSRFRLQLLLLLLDVFALYGLHKGSHRLPAAHPKQNLEATMLIWAVRRSALVVFTPNVAPATVGARQPKRQGALLEGPV